MPFTITDHSRYRRRFEDSTAPHESPNQEDSSTDKNQTPRNPDPPRDTDAGVITPKERDLLALAREGNRVDDIETVDLGTLTENCWNNVATGEATFSVDIDRTIRSDQSRLQQLLENLYRNAIEHGGDDVAVSVGALPDGFYIEDDGPGIPVDELEDVFDAGYSTTEDGTGFGLSIVQQIADAHGWDIRVTDGSDGGARFEVTGIKVAE
ncbi:HAMP domain-containing histidine kinase [Haloarcula sp. 1CSR25-25]|nr:HAMP domain-containing histidine kinase [Haloarcula sp. 1CSR25-25]